MLTKRCATCGQELSHVTNFPESARPWLGLAAGQQTSDQIDCAPVQSVFVRIEFVEVSPVRSPAHSLRLGWELPIIGVQVADEARLDFRLSAMRPIYCRSALRAVGEPIGMPRPEVMTAERKIARLMTPDASAIHRYFG
jgi:hypothetical protein